MFLIMSREHRPKKGKFETVGWIWKTQLVLNIEGSALARPSISWVTIELSSFKLQFRR